MADVMNYVGLANIYEKKNVSLMEKNKYKVINSSLGLDMIAKLK